MQDFLITSKQNLKKFIKKCCIIFKSLIYYYRSTEHGSLAQLGEHLPYKQAVVGSSPTVSTKYLPLWGYAGMAQR